jgi:hypothetical protein
VDDARTANKSGSFKTNDPKTIATNFLEQICSWVLSVRLKNTGILGGLSDVLAGVSWTWNSPRKTDEKEQDSVLELMKEEGE